MQTDGELGELPAWYRTLKAAQSLNVPPWALAEQPLAWQEWVVTASYAEGFVREEQRKKAERKSKARTGATKKR